MGKQKSVSLTINQVVVAKAKELGLNLSKTCENCLKQRTKALQQLNRETNGGQGFFGKGFFQKKALVGRAGFEPASFCTSSRRPNRARLPALGVSSTW